ncbi:MAG: glycosyltransferase family 4 protein [Candidatus Thiodiazotropha sp.]|nr:glycosyltransferase family 4 protein [Candidatus Thiodiazotropha taylori]MBT3057879.1 glycosyltransferase family 4 protein [Candidatus Thiodiazotropha sp. (ex Lucina pensylvanica)]MBV2093662.1 glycosyltransferase family 4 protein [Candidatus Thiodiazotropha sp. (ex Codakia orbicularis)]PUB72541.1 MAG: glycosyltransferase family 1 protein [gamma proteobacterium symbiont of Ctena orbiculata]MBT3062096.1 glycosyltransferase family 4 protein [Candidatus Thiodiazotropha sp. (ex Lucina pensylvanic
MSHARPRNRLIIFVVNDPGFFLSHRLPLALAARDQGYEVCVATPPGDGVEQIKAEGLHYRRVSLSRSGANPLLELWTIWSLYKLYREMKPLIVHHVTIKPVLYGTLAARLAGVSAVVNAISGLGFVFLARGWFSAMARSAVLTSYRWLFSRKRLWVIVQNRDDYDYLLEKDCLSQEKIELIRGSGVDVERFMTKPEANGLPVVVLPGRMLWDKGVGEFVAAAQLLHRMGIRARFILVGGIDPSNPESVPAVRLAEWARDGDVEWWGNRQDMPAIYNLAHIVCLPSYREGLPKVLLEAAASGRAIVATDVPGCREVVIEEENGLLVPARESGPLADALRRLITNPQLRHSMGLKSRVMAEAEFSIKQVVERHMDIYQRALEQ